MAVAPIVPESVDRPADEMDRDDQFSIWIVVRSGGRVWCEQSETVEGHVERGNEVRRHLVAAGDLGEGVPGDGLLEVLARPDDKFSVIRTTAGAPHQSMKRFAELATVEAVKHLWAKLPIGRKHPPLSIECCLQSTDGIWSVRRL